MKNVIPLLRLPRIKQLHPPLTIRECSLNERNRRQRRGKSSSSWASRRRSEGDDEIGEQITPTLPPSPHPEFAKAQAHRCPEESARIEEGRVRARKEKGVWKYARAANRERSPKGVREGAFPANFALLPCRDDNCISPSFSVLRLRACVRALSLLSLPCNGGGSGGAHSLLRSLSPTTRRPPLLPTALARRKQARV